MPHRITRTNEGIAADSAESMGSWIGLRLPPLPRAPRRPDLPRREEVRQRPLLARAGREIPDSATREQHFGQESQKRAHGEKKREPEGDEQGNSGLVSKRSDEKKQSRERCRDP